MRWQGIAEQAAQARCSQILERVESAIGRQAPGARVERSGDEMRARGRGLRARWICDAGLRFARRTGA